VGLVGLRHDQQTRGVLVEAVDDSRTLGAAGRRQRDPEADERVDERAAPRPVAGVDD
jgi:hypothetical protein